MCEVVPGLAQSCTNDRLNPIRRRDGILMLPDAHHCPVGGPQR
jgi:hypothetical protein